MRNRRKLYENSPAKIPNLLNCRFFTAYGGVAVVWRWCAHQGISLQFGTVARASLSHGQTTSRWRSRSYLFDVGYRALISHSGSFHRVSI
jgi:hypothetical protein